MSDKKILFVTTILIGLTLLRAPESFANRNAGIDQLVYAVQIVEPESKESEEGDAEAQENKVIPPDPFAAERAVALKGSSSGSVDKAKTDQTDHTAKDSQETSAMDKKSSSGNSKKQPSMYYYQ